MIKAYILIDVRKGHTLEVVDKLQPVDEIEHLSFVTGEYDIIVRVSVPTLEDLYNLMVDLIEPIEGVNKTVTSVVEKDFK